MLSSVVAPPYGRAPVWDRGEAIKRLWTGVICRRLTARCWCARPAGC